MRNGFHDTLVNMKRALNEFLAIACDNTGVQGNPVAAKVPYFLQLLMNHVHRIPFVGTIILIENFSVFANQHQFGCGAAAVNAKIGATVIAMWVCLLHRSFGMPCAKCFIFRF